MNLNRYGNLIIVATIILLNFIVYFNSIQNDFVWDDKSLIRDNHEIRDPGNLKKLLTTEDAVPNFAGTGFYRPLINLTYILDHQIYGSAASGFRTTNIIFHTLCSVILFYLVLLITGNRAFAFAVALIFSVQTVHVEAVSFISSRNNVICTFFILLSLYFFIKNSGSNKISHLIYSMLFLFLGAASKEFAFVAPIIFILYDYTYDPEFSIRKNIGKYILSFCVILLFFLIKTYVVSVKGGVSLGTDYLANRIFTTLPIMVKYMYSQVIPHNLSLHEGIALKESFFDFSVLSSLLVLIAIIVLAIRYRKSDKLLFFSFCSYFVLLLPVSNILVISSAMMADRWLYPASFAFSIVLTRLAYVILRKKEELIPFFVIAFVLFLSLFTIQRNHVFKNNFELFSDAVKKNPASAKLRSNLGLAYLQRGNVIEAEKQYKLAIEYDPDFPLSYNKLGVIYANRGDYDDAFVLFNKSYTLNPQYPITVHNIALIYQRKGDLDNSNKFFNIAISLNPNLFESYFSLADNYYNQKDYDKALKLLNIILAKPLNKADHDRAKEIINMIRSSMNR